MKKSNLIIISMAILSLLAACGNPAGEGGNNSGGGSGGGSEPGGNHDPGGTTDDNDEYIYNGKKQGSEPFTPIELNPIDYVQVFCPTSYNGIYAWIEEGSKVTNLLGDWPGTSLANYNDNWNTYSFPKNYTTFKVIFNNPDQTADLEINGVGHYWYNNGQLIKGDTEPEQTTAGGEVWASKNPLNIFIDSDDYEQPQYIPKPKYLIVNSARDYTELPVVRNWNKNSIVSPYRGSRDDFRDESIYFAMTTRFYDGDASNNTHCWSSSLDAGVVNDEPLETDPNWRGDFKGLIEKMDYIKAQGFTSIWITPIVKNASGFDYHGYHAINFKEVDPRYLSEDVDFQKVLNEAHKRDMKIILDVVLNHTGNWGEENLFPMFYYDSKNNTTLKAMTKNRAEGYAILDDSYETSNDPYKERINAMKGTKDVNNIYHHGDDMSYESYSEQTGQIAGDCVDLNTENPTVANYLVEAYAKFIQMGVDAFRVDTVKHISRLTLNKYYVPAFHDIAKKCGNNNFFMFGEVCTRFRGVWNKGIASDSAPFYTWKESQDWAWGDRATNENSTSEHWIANLNPDNQPSSNNSTLNGVTYHTPDHSKFSGLSVIDFPMHWSFGTAGEAFNMAKDNDYVYNDATYNIVYTESHDYSPDETQDFRFNKGTAAWKENLSLTFTFRGIPCIYYGNEIEFKAGARIDEGPNLSLQKSGRAYFGNYLEGDVTPTGFGKYSNASGNMKTTLESTLSRHLQKLNQARLSCIALRRGQYTTSNYSGGGIGFTRRYTANGVDSIAAVVISGSGNFSNLPNGTYKDLYSGKVTTVSGGNLYAETDNAQGSVAIYVKQ